MPRIVLGTEELFLNRQDSSNNPPPSTAETEEDRKEVLASLAGQLNKICVSRNDGSNRPSRSSNDDHAPDMGPSSFSGMDNGPALLMGNDVDHHSPDDNNEYIEDDEDYDVDVHEALLSSSIHSTSSSANHCPSCGARDGQQGGGIAASSSARQTQCRRCTMRLDLRQTTATTPATASAPDPAVQGANRPGGFDRPMAPPPMSPQPGDDFNYIESPISPSFAAAPKYRPPEHRRSGAAQPSRSSRSTSSKAGPASGARQSSSQLCFGMDQSSMLASPMTQSYFEDSMTAGADEEDEAEQRDYQHVVSAPVPRRSATTAALTNTAPTDEGGSSGVSSCAVSEHLHPSHRVQTGFVPRHAGELALKVGDPVFVERESEDHWSAGTNLRSGQSGVFPSVMVFEIDVVDELFTMQPTLSPREEDRDTFCLTLLGSIEVAHHKGNDVLIQAINKVLALYQCKEELIVPRSVLVEISFKGIHVIDKGRRNLFRCPKFDYFYSLQNISFCGAHPKQLRYFAYITKHPLLPRFAAHVFLSSVSTQPVVESVGRAFKRCYDEYMAFAHPTEDIFLE